ncbi:hypothetical protein [Actinoplanes sp. G11-F43]|uniref:hypothetical protein n=1 Tax=Actinoplanes sp. G11-F43 TaxID=3424130 RepID=UPI003D33852B
MKSTIHRAVSALVLTAALVAVSGGVAAVTAHAKPLRAETAPTTVLAKPLRAE